MGIAGNQILADGAGVSALARFDRDVLSQPGVKWLMILEGINDMNFASLPETIRRSGSDRGRSDRRNEADDRTRSHARHQGHWLHLYYQCS